MFGFKSSKLVLGGMIPRSKTRIAFITDEIPLAPSVWPIFDLIEPLHKKI